MIQQENNRRIFKDSQLTIEYTLSGFYTDRRSRDLSPRTLDFF